MAQLTPDEQKELLALARKTIEVKLFGRSEIEAECDAFIFSEDKGLFVTIHRLGHLRGCIGTLDVNTPLREIVVQMAKSSAFKDPRFPPLSEREYAEIDIEISVLSAPYKIDSPEEVEVGSHGIIISKGHRKGLLLPQVATERNWDRETFLNHTCIKAGLPEDAWRGDVTIEVFEAEVFGEKDFIT